MPVRERIKIFHVTVATLEQEVNNFLANNEEIDGWLDVKVVETGNNNTAVAVLIYKKREEGAFSVG